ncbi:ATP-binding cassette sub-family C member Sur isoform X2 [Teleopsis dalmanni]|uniref:ATP-binding cassette sub-family C member Sur isoform X2 n=1 Tax=Teleopsis dalmanni TaxID=139649 RepID=UPI0018CDE7B3|nr:ATP-binding cassette sub-family C member Sur isoform X2 [Teleopsis dalmanni]
MGLIIYCDKLSTTYFPPNLQTDICSISAIKWKLLLFASAILVITGMYLLFQWKYRSHRTLLIYHNLRAPLLLLLLTINTLELARALLSEPAVGRNGGIINRYDGISGTNKEPVINEVQQRHQQQEQVGNNEIETDRIVVVIGVSMLWNALCAILLTILLIVFHRIVELKKKVEFLYVSVGVEILVFAFRIYELAEIVYDQNIYELESCLQAMTAICLLSVGMADGFSIYKERFKPDYFEDYEKIGYKHTLATFYSKTVFWWLNPLLWFGYKEPLELEDLGEMRLEDSARAHYDQFLLIYKTAKVKNNDRPPSLWYCYLKYSWRMFSLGGILKLFGDLFSLIGPLAIQQIVQYIEVMYNAHYPTLPQLNNNNLTMHSSNLSNYNSAYNYNNNNKAGNISNHIISNNNNLSITLRGLKNLYNDSLRNNSSGNHISTRATGSIWLPNPGDNGNNQIANDIYYDGAEVKIYYPSWLDLVSNGWAIAWIVLLAALAQGALSQASTHILNMTGIRIKTSLQGLIYRKTLLLLNFSYMDNGPDGIPKGNNNSMDENKYEREKDELQNTATTSSTQTSTKDNSFGGGSSGGSADVGTITNLMSEDTLNIMSFFWIVHYVWAIPLKIAVVMYLLYVKLGISAVIGSFVCILTMTPLQFLIGKAMSTNAGISAKFTDERLRKIHDTFIGIKLIKLNAWDDVFLKKITTARKKELKYLNKDSVYWTLMTILTHLSTVLITFVTLAVYINVNTKNNNADTNEFTASRLFSALALFQQLTVPLLIFPITVPIIISAVVSTRRLENFLQSREIQKQFEGIRNMARILSKSDASLDMYEVKDKSTLLVNNINREDNKQSKKENKVNERLVLKINIPEKPAPLAHSEPHTPLAVPEPLQLPPSLTTAVTDASGTGIGMSCHANEDKPPICNCMNECLLKYYETRARKLSLQRRELLRNTPYVVIRPRKAPNSQLQQTKRYDSWHRDSLLLKMQDDVAVSVKDACFAWNPDHFQHTLSIKDISIPKNAFTIIVGKNGSGKSSLLSALLMEMPLMSGDMIWNKTSTIAFVPQLPWLLNTSIRENITFGESFRPKRYDFVLEACALKPDIELMPQGDMTVIGERGINLSGGQRQRVAIARALYSSANVVIMDDPFSSLDNEVARHIFEQSIRKMLLKSNRTVILVTQQLNLVQQAAYLIVMKDCHLQAAGSYKDIELKYPHIIAKWNSIVAKAREKEQQSSTVVGRTARERWKLFKNVSKLGLQRSISAVEAKSVGDDIEAEMDMADVATENEDILPASLPSKNALRCSQSLGSFSLVRKRSSVYGSRHLIYDVPLPIDECQTEDVIMRRRRRGTHRRISSRASSRLSGISNNSLEMRRSVLTTSCSSATSYVSNNSSNVSTTDCNDSISTNEVITGPHMRVQSWQPQSVAATKMQHPPVARNISSPSTFLTTVKHKEHQQQHKYQQHQLKQKQQQEQQQQQQQQYINASTATTTPASDAAIVADLVKSSRSDGGFQQFLRRMSMRRSNKPSTVVVHRMHRPLSATNSILSISEETTTVTAAPSIELTSVVARPETVTKNEAETEACIPTQNLVASTEHGKPAQDTNIDYKVLTNNKIVTASSTCTDGTESPLAMPTDAGKTTTVGAEVATAAVAPTTVADVERKYGKIPMQIYLLYLRASGLPIVLIFFATALIWQCLRVYTDVWLQHWTDDNAATGFSSTTMATTAASMEPAPILRTSDTAQHEVTYYFRVYAVISCVCMVMAMISTPAGQFAGCNARRNLHDKLLRTIMRKSLHFFQVTPLGRIMNRFSNDMAIIDKKIAATSQRLLQFMLLCLCAVLINVSITPWFVLLTVPICIAYYVIQKFYRCSSRELQRIENSTNSPVISHLSETIQGVTTIRAYNQESRFTEILFKRLEMNTIAFTILNTSNRWLGISLDYLGGVIVFVAIVTALLVATISCSNYNSSGSSQYMMVSGNYTDNGADRFGAGSGSNAANLFPHGSHINLLNDNKRNMVTGPNFSPSPSLVGLAINYTLLVPIYLNWVVKLLADMEMYVGSVERIAYYAEEEMETSTEIVNMAMNDSDGDGNGNGNGDDDCDDDAKDNENVSDKTANNDAIKLQGTIAADADAAPADNVGVGVAGDIIATQQTEEIKQNEKLSMTVMERNDVERRASVRKMSNGKNYKTVPISWPQRGDISFESVSLKYEGKSENVITNLTLKIPAGQRIGICGRTGSGKSSLAFSLFGVLQTTSGRIRIDDVDITQIHPDEIRTRLSIIPQDVHLFNATIRENLDPPGYYSDLALWNCLELAQLKEFVNVQMPQGLDTEITDGGSTLSAGHRQLFCLARAILRGSVCLILDEATSSLDSTTENALLAAAHKAFQGRTILTIAHRLSTILDYDRIIVLENGKIVEDGSPAELQRKSNGIFNTLLLSGRPLSAASDCSILQDFKQESRKQS